MKVIQRQGIELIFGQNWTSTMGARKINSHIASGIGHQEFSISLNTIGTDMIFRVKNCIFLHK